MIQKVAECVIYFGLFLALMNFHTSSSPSVLFIFLLLHLGRVCVRSLTEVQQQLLDGKRLFNSQQLKWAIRSVADYLPPTGPGGPCWTNTTWHLPVCISMWFTGRAEWSQRCQQAFLLSNQLWQPCWLAVMLIHPEAEVTLWETWEESFTSRSL